MDCKVVLTKKNPHEKSNILSKLFLTWSFKLFYRTHRKGLTVEDLSKTGESNRSSALGDRLEQAWEQELKQAKDKDYKPSLTRAIIRTFWFHYTIYGFFQGILFVVLWPLIPYTLSLFIFYFSQKRTEELYRTAHIHNFLMNLLSLTTSMMMSHLILLQTSIGMRVRIACCSVLYRKILRLGRGGLTKTEPGQVINLMSNDVNRFDVASQYLNFLWVMPVVIPVVSALVWQNIGIATLAALAVIFLQTILVQAYLSNLQGVLRGKIAKRTDQRVKVMTELLNGVQVIKMYAWEKPFEKLVDKLRKMEVKYILRTSMIKGFSTALSVFTERFILFTAVTTFVVLGGDIRPEITFSLVQYFNLLQLAANICFPLALSSLAEAKVSIKRIEEFLQLDEFETSEDDKNTMIVSKTEKQKISEKENFKQGPLELSKVSASWKFDTVDTTLKNINITALPGEFIGIAGQVGSGKTSLLQVILGELPPIQGTVSIGGATISYASQEPWLFVATVVTACALMRDFEQLPSGDSTLVGERGISLSGGQRARIGLARACYRKADIYLLDDPLSAVDTHVGKHLVSECVLGLLRDSTRILVTHQLHHLKSADKVVILRHGEVEAQASFEEISRSPLFNELLQEEEEPENETFYGYLRQRAVSLKSQQSIRSTRSTKSGTALSEKEFVEVEDDVEVDEMTGSGRVSGAVYKHYFSAGSGCCLFSTTMFAIILAQVVTSFSDLWLTYWMNTVEDNHQILQTGFLNQTTHSNVIRNNKTSDILNFTVIPESAFNSSLFGQDIETTLTIHFNNSFYIYVWGIAILGCIVLTTSRSMLFLWICMRSSINLHNQIFSNILSATMRFFDTNPSGRILNRFSKDMGVVDEILPRMYLDSIQVIMVMIGILVMVAIVNPYMVITTSVCAIFMYLWTAIYLSTAQAIKRVEGVTRSPVFSHVSATMAGLNTVRACKAQNMLRTQFDDKQDVHTSAWYLTLITNTAFSVWLSLICTMYVIITSYTFLFLDNGDTQSSNVGLALSQGLILVTMVQYGIKQTTEVISQMTSVERVVQFTSLPQESTEGPSPPKGWPQKARLTFKDLSLRYDKDADPVLKKLNIEIESGWKVGVVGRTGAGKSSLISALFRLAPLEGHVFIDDVDSGSIALKELRSKISIIPQEPVLFSASLRYNLDPFDKYTDAEIWEALEQVELKQSVTSLSEMVESGGSNYSAGQRQLLCLARAALGRNKLLVLDEATANVDPNTDALIQKSIRKNFADCTVITVAHRLHTVADSNRVVVMEAGKIVECGHPHELLQEDEGHLTRMVKQLGPAAEQSLRDLAAAAYELHHDPNNDKKGKTY